MVDLGRDPLELARRHFADRGAEAHVVGGRVRDALLGRATWDTDLVVPDGALAHARELARRFEGAFVPLDEERGIARVVWPPGDGASPVLDLADMVGPDLHADLSARDFTVNAMAVPLDAGWPPGRSEVIDPCGGASDLGDRTLRMTSEEALEADPLRLLRAVRLAAELGFSIEPGTRSAIAARAPTVRGPAAERTRDEILRIVKAPDTAASVRLLLDVGLLEHLVPALAASRPEARPDAGPEARPEAGPEARPGAGRNVFGHSLAVVGAMETIDRILAGRPMAGGHTPVPSPFESVLIEFREPLRALLWRDVMGGYTRSVYLELAALLHDFGKPEARAAKDLGRPHLPHGEVGAIRAAEWAAGLRFGVRETDYLSTVVKLHPRPLAMARGKGATRAAIYRFFADAGPAGVDIALLALADNSVKPEHSRALTQAIASVVERLLHAWFVEPEVAVDPIPLLSGTQVMDALGLDPGPEVGRILEVLREAQAVGDVVDAEGALELARQVSGQVSRQVSRQVAEPDQG